MGGEIISHSSFLMRRAVELALKGAGWTSPNPLVGAVVEKNGRIIGEGYHKKWKTNHAEVNALESCVESPEGSTLYTTLEPCSRFGFTPPCIERIKESKIKKVIIGALDPTLNNEGVEGLKTSGIEVILLDDLESKRLIRPFVTHRTQNRPFVTVKIASTLDGKVATKTKESKWITGEDARREGHRLRHQSDAILAGVGTVISDNPILTTRFFAGDTEIHHPIRVILDSKLRIPLASHVIKDRTSRTIIATTLQPSFIIDELKSEGIEIIQCDKNGEMVSLRDLLRQLAARNIMSLLVEGGSTVISSFFREGLVDWVIQYISPTFLGGDAVSSLGELNIGSLSNRIMLQDVSINNIGDDFVVEGEVRHPEQSEGSLHRHPERSEGSFHRHPERSEGSFHRHPEQSEGSFHRHPEQSEGSFHRHPEQSEGSQRIDSSATPQNDERRDSSATPQNDVRHSERSEESQDV